MAEALDICREFRPIFSSALNPLTYDVTAQRHDAMLWDWFGTREVQQHFSVFNPDKKSAFHWVLTLKIVLHTKISIEMFQFGRNKNQKPLLNQYLQALLLDTCQCHVVFMPFFEEHKIIVDDEWYALSQKIPYILKDI